MTEITQRLIKIMVLLLMAEMAHGGECGCDTESDGDSAVSHGYDSERYSRAKEGNIIIVMLSWHMANTGAKSPCLATEP